jgi:hypothetical protein
MKKKTNISFALESSSPGEFPPIEVDIENLLNLYVRRHKKSPSAAPDRDGDL